MRNRFVLPNILTTFGLSCGLFVIFRMTMIAPGTVELDQIRSCLLIILLATFIDTLDGALARAMKVESDFGGFFDSMSDSVVFGVAPAVLALKTLSPSSDSFWGMMVYIGAMVFSVAGVLRLVRYSTMSQAPQDPKLQGVFVGLPITSAAGAMASLTVFVTAFFEKSEQKSSFDMRQLILTGAFLFLGYLMISRWRFPSLKALHVRYTTGQLLFAAACLAPVLLLLLINKFIFTCMLVFWGYILVSFGRVLYFVARGKKELMSVPPDEE